ncbi:MAG TPA: GGDEF domain-containing protein [Nitrospiria bacterium]|nr:GGDEF domain-containing protein [Nitrospiria bacterium]
MDDETTIGSINLSNNLSRRRMDWINYHLACLVVVAGPVIGEKFPLSKEQMVIGRQQDAEIPIDDPMVSRKHAEVVRESGDRVVLRDLDSKNGTFCNDAKVGEKELSEGDLIRVGNSILRYVGPNSLDHLYQDELSERALRDGLTGFFNKPTFRLYLERNLERCKNLHAPLSIGLIDFDGFKKVGEGERHPAGDRVLKEFADRVKSAIRPTDLLARYGGDEFGLILPLTHLMGGRLVGERLRTRVADQAFEVDGQAFSMTISVGIAERSGGAEDADALVARADAALREAKRMGGNITYCFMEPKK